jgi:peptidoglycan-associated lipoprotein
VLEALIARYPDAPSADEARRELYALYRSDSRIAGRPSNRVPPDDAVVASARSAPLKQDTNNWQASTFSPRALQTALRDEAGDRIFFSAGSADIGARSRLVIQAQARWLLQHPQLAVRIEGHADDSRAGADNESLSRQRAETVRGALVGAGVDARRIRTAGIGARDPIAECDDNACAAQNRRVLLKVLAPSGATPGFQQHTDLRSSTENGFQR